MNIAKPIASVKTKIAEVTQTGQLSNFTASAASAAHSLRLRLTRGQVDMPALPAPSAPSRRSVSGARMEGQAIFLARVAFGHRPAGKAAAAPASGGVGSAAAAAEGDGAGRDTGRAAASASVVAARGRPKEVAELISRWTDLLPGSLGANEEQARPPQAAVLSPEPFT